jgi:hypothetical protein
MKTEGIIPVGEPDGVKLNTIWGYWLPSLMKRKKACWFERCGKY